MLGSLHLGKSLFRHNSISKAALASGQRIEGLEQRKLFAATMTDPASLPFGQTITSFGVSGHVIAPATITGTVKQLIVGADGDFYAAGDDGIARFTSAGAIDKHFGTSGFTGLLGGTFIAEAVDSAGHVYALVKADNNTVLIRYTTSGDADTTYGQNGTALVLTDANFTPTALAVQSDDKLIIAGTETSNNNNTVVTRLLRVTTAGASDSSFGSSGSAQVSLGATTVLDPDEIDDVYGISVLSNGNILVGGTSEVFDSSGGTRPATHFAIARLNSSGALDTSYGNNGVTRTGNFSAFDNESGTFAVRSDGGAFLVRSDNYNSNDIIAASVNASGGLVFDKSLAIDPLSSGTVIDMAALSDGRAVILSNATSSNTGFALTPLSAKGVAGSTVLTDDLNTATTDIGGNYTAGIAVASGGQIVVAGTPTSAKGYEIQEFNQSTATAPPPGLFAHGGPSSLAIAADGSVDVAYYNLSSADLMFVQRQRNGLWSTPITLDARPGAGEYLSVAADSHGNPSIAYYDRKSKSLKYATSSNHGKTFSVALLDATADVGEFNSLYIDPSSAIPSIAYYDKTNGNLKYATESKHKWTITTIDSTGDVGQQASLHATYGGRLAVAYVDNTNGYVKFTEQNSKGKFVAKNAARAAKGAESLSWSSDYYNSPAIVFHDLGTGDLRLASYGGSSFDLSTLASGSGQATGISYQVSNYYVYPTVYTYSKSHKTLTLITNSTSGTPSASTFLSGAGAYLSVQGVDSYYSSSKVLAAFVTTAGDLEIMNLPS